MSAPVEICNNLMLPKKVVVFVDYGNPYSSSLANSFAVALEVKQVSVYFVRYVRDEGQTTVPGLVQKALSYKPDLIYFAVYANDFDLIRGNLSAISSTVPVMGGDGLYELGGYQQSDTTAALLFDEVGVRESIALKNGAQRCLPL